MERSKKTFGKFSIFLFATLSGLLVLLAITPSFLSTNIGTRCLCYLIQKRSNILIDIQNLQLGWLTPQFAKEVKIQTKDASIKIVSKDIHNASSLISMFFKNDHIGLTQIDKFDVLFSGKKDVSTTSTSSKQSHPRSFSVLQNIYIRDGSIKLEKNSSSSSINHFELNMQLRHDKVVLATKGSSIAKDAEGFFDVFCSVNLLNFDIEGRLNTSMFPLAIFDEVLDLDNLLEKTLGPTLNANSSFHLNDDKLCCSLEMLSAAFKASIHTTQTADYVFLEKPSVVSLTLTKDSVEALSEKLDLLKNIHLSQVSSLQIFLDELKVPYLKKTLNFDKASYKTRLFTSSLNLLNKKTQKPLLINASTLSSSSDALASGVFFTIKSSLNYNLKNPSYVNGSAFIASPLHGPHLTNVQAKVTKLPTMIFETLSSKSSNFIDLIGETIDLNITTKNPGVNPLFSMQIYSPLASLEDIEIETSEDGMMIKKPFQIVYKTPKKPLKDFLSSYNISLSEVGTTRCSIDQANLSKTGFEKEGFEALSFSGSLQVEDMAISSPYLLGKCKIKNTKIDFSAPSLKKLEIKTAAGLSFIDPHSFQQDLFGNIQSFQGAGVIEKLTKKNFSIPYLNISFFNDKASLDLICSITDNLKKFSFLEPLSLNFNINPDLFYRLFNVSSKETAFIFPSPLKLLMNAEPFNLQEHFSKQLKINTSIAIAQVQVIDKLYGKEFTIENTQIVAKGDGNLETLEAAFSSEIVPKEISLVRGNIQADFLSKSFSSLDFLDNPWFIKGLFYHIPNSLFDVSLGLNNTFSTLLGADFTNNFTLEHQNSTFKLTGDFQSPHIIFGYNVAKTPDFVSLESPIQGTLTLEKDSYSALESLLSKDTLSKQTFALNQPSNISFKINRLKWLTKQSLVPQGSFFDRLLNNLSEHLNLSVVDFTLQSQLIDILCQENAQTASLKNFALDCSKAEGIAPFVFNVRSDVSTNKQKNVSSDGHFISTAFIQNILNSSKQNVLSTKIEGSLTEFPSMILDMGFQLMRFGKIPPSVVLGNTISSSFVAKFENNQGTIDADVKAQEASGSLHAYTNNGILKLSQPLQAHVNVTPTLVDFFFKNMNLNITQSTAPLSLVIDNRGFFIPLDPYDFQSIQIRKGSLNLGQITCTNSGNPQEVGSFFKLNLGSKDVVNLWFTPIDFSLSNGIIYIDRTEILYNKAYEIAVWGKLDVLQNFASMTLGLTEQSLRKALGVRGLPRSFVLQLPMEGPVDNVKINKEIATTRIALFLAKTSGATNYGGLWGGIASALSDFANDQTMVPPAKPPYPWEGKLSSYEQEHKNQDTVHIIR